MRSKILYTGLDPTRFKGHVHHVPFIDILPRPFHEVECQFQQLCTTPDVLLTSRSAVSLFLNYAQQASQPYWDKRFFAVGQATAALLMEHGMRNILIAKQECCEGMCELLKQHPPQDLFYPHAFLARKVISAYLTEHQKNYIDVILYTTRLCTPQPLPNLQHYEKVIFTSPSTVQAFLACYTDLPRHLCLVTIGPVTKQALIKALQHTAQLDQIDD